MKWFARRQSADIWDEPIQGPIGDIEAAERIRHICETARAGAEAVGGSARTAERERERERERYERAARVAMEIAMKIADDLMRDDAVRRIVDLCMKADDAKTAQILFRAIQAGWVREAVQRDYPALAQ
ncbi:hypothetical protein E4K66_07470 [Bradyrhizobium frederickii]|uniref:Uncharacterized protein n=1 Tax=Bradyrhizobium frederickii TaxID=2560054 RepID=A0A4Y9LCJ8_9BRAD|nr:hypothetical protein [Bradyrhizobium frederickii]TFV40679.1 hypothetical protein E4K66_07470 [Bradyrhizobium frederickii]